MLDSFLNNLPNILHPLFAKKFLDPLDNLNASTRVDKIDSANLDRGRACHDKLKRVSCIGNATNSYH
ncbi:MAG: hypothetical protein AUH89_00390 [Ktedonobacter sp. 13_1_40CM_4_52_4]|nr:MAG: hypothetical protein AUH89_00390 [Ktedonobacter sp. 13_1_40CM_4_52_4]